MIPSAMVLEFPDTTFAWMLDEHEDVTPTQSPDQVMTVSVTSIMTFCEPEGAVGTEVSAVPVMVAVPVFPVPPYTGVSSG